MEMKFKIEGIDCANCAAKLEGKIQKIDGVESATLSFMSEKLTMIIDESKKDAILKELKKLIKKEEPDAEWEEI